MRRALIIARVVWLDMLRRKDLYVMAILLLTLLFVLMSLNLFGLGAVIRYILDVGLLLAWLFSLVLVVGLAARQLPREESRGTIFPLLAKPVTRGELLLGKWLGSWTAS
ncbi:MAG: ABC transporter permease subunit, partial [Verrucomicrobia bacterium]|nr:ABC transporter permease subunit [Verrucomicrobiota bacterium]